MAGAGILPELARQTLLFIAQLIEALTIQIRKIETKLLAWHRSNPASQRLETIPGIGVITATVLAATVLDARAFRSGRQFAAWLGLVPRQNSSGDKDRLGSISKMGDRYLRHLLVVGATAVVRYTRRKASPPDWSPSPSPTGWLGSPLGRHGAGGKLSRAPHHRVRSTATR